MRHITCSQHTNVGYGLIRSLMLTRVCSARLSTSATVNKTFEETHLLIKSSFCQDSSKIVSTCINKKHYSRYIAPSKSKVESLGEDKVVDSGLKPSFTTLRMTAAKQEMILEQKLKEAEIIGAGHMTNEDWNVMRTAILEVGGGIKTENIDAVIMKNCSDMLLLSLGKSYFRYLKSTKKEINRATYGNYLLIFYRCSSKCTEHDLNEIYDVYQELYDVHSVVDCYTAEKVILALSVTKHWREYEKLFKDIAKSTYLPNKNVCSAVIQAAFKNNEFNLGWELMYEIQSRGQSIPDEVFIFLCEFTNHKDKDKSLTQVLDFLKMFSIKPSLRLCEVFKDTFDDKRSGRKGAFTSISRSGYCKSCNTKLETARVLKEDYDQLKNTFLNPVLLGKDIFQKTKPEEFSEFLEYLKKTASFDVVLDGLNIGLQIINKKKMPRSSAFQLKSVVQHFIQQKKKVLVIGRKHMRTWDKNDMNYIYMNAAVFLADDISQDDPFMLYATLYGGLGTYFVSKDMMRGHKFLLADHKLQATFQKWQAQHQYFVNFIEGDGTVHLKDPIPFMQSIQQTSQGDWHIPYLVKENLTEKTKVDNFHRHWLCLPNQPTRQKTFDRIDNQSKVWKKNVVNSKSRAFRDKK